MKTIGKFRLGVVRVRGMYGLGATYHHGMRVLDVQVGPWTFQVEGPQ